jgi:hypothetical protein
MTEIMDIVFAITGACLAFMSGNFLYEGIVNKDYKTLVFSAACMVFAYICIYAWLT